MGESKRLSIHHHLNGTSFSTPIESEFRDGLNCPSPYIGENDWIVLKLSKPIPNGISPYKVGDAGAMKMGAAVTAVNGVDGSYPLRYAGNPNKARYDKKIADCTWGKQLFGQERQYLNGL